MPKIAATRNVSVPPRSRPAAPRPGIVCKSRTKGARGDRNVKSTSCKKRGDLEDHTPSAPHVPHPLGTPLAGRELQAGEAAGDGVTSMSCLRNSCANQDVRPEACISVKPPRISIEIAACCPVSASPAGHFVSEKKTRMHLLPAISGE